MGRDVVIMAGGLGLVPLLPALHALARRRGDYRRLTILYGARSPADILFAEQLETWRKDAGADVRITVDHADEHWVGAIGVVTHLLRHDMFDPNNVLAMVCGPEVMMRFSANALIDQGVPAESIHLSMERNMKCAIGHCGHCQFGPTFICRDGAVFSYDKLRPFLGLREI